MSKWTPVERSASAQSGFRCLRIFRGSSMVDCKECAKPSILADSGAVAPLSRTCLLSNPITMM